jgi:glycosyltransferase involved in cell wall biosynthesis
VLKKLQSARTEPKKLPKLSNSTTILILLGRVDCIDGVAAYIENLVTGLRDKGDPVVLVSGAVTTGEGSEARRDVIAGSVREWVVLQNLWQAWPKLSLIREILTVIRRNGVDVISPQGFSMLPLAWLLGLLTRRSVVANYHPSVHGTDARSMSGVHLKRQLLLYRTVAKFCRPTCFVAFSYQMAQFFRDECRIPQDRIREQVLGIESDFYRPPTEAERGAARERFAIADGTLVTVLPGRMSFNKGHDVAADAIRALRVSRPDIPILCLFPGGGLQRDIIQSKILTDAADHASFRFLGYVDREILRETYWAADIVLLPSRMEGFGLVVAEAMCCGAIAIRTPSGGWQDQIIEGQTGYVVPFNDPAALAAAIEKVADAPNRAVMREQTLAFACAKFAKARMIDGISAIYREAASLNPRGPGRDTLLRRRAASPSTDPLQPKTDVRASQREAPS